MFVMARLKSIPRDEGKLDINIGDFRHFVTVAIQNLLCGSYLNTTRKTRPSARGKNGVCDSFSIGSKTNYLLEDIFSFLVHCSTCFKHDGSEVVIRLLKSSGVSIDFLMLGIRLTGLRRVKMRGCEGTDDSDVNGKAPAETPVLDRNITRPTT